MSRMTGLRFVGAVGKKMRMSKEKAGRACGEY